MNLDVKEITDVKSVVYYKEYHWPGTNCLLILTIKSILSQH